MSRSTTPWVKIALLGLGVQLTVEILWHSIISLGLWAVVWIAIPFGGLENLHAILYIIAIPIVYNVLRQWPLSHPLIIASSSVLTLIGLQRIREKLPINNDLELGLYGYEPSLLGYGAPVIAFGALVIISALLFLLSTFVVHKFRNLGLVLTIFLVIVVGTHAFATFYQKPSPAIADLPKVKEVDWKLLPSSLPTWLEDGYTNSGGSCVERISYAGYFVCEYMFVNYPGYLSIESQMTISSTRDLYPANKIRSNFEPSPFFKVTVIKNDKENLGPYKYQNKKCDWEGLQSVGKNPRHRDGTLVRTEYANPRRCAFVTTPGGKKLYYDSYLNYGSAAVQAPHSFYFEQDEAVVLISVNNSNYIAKNHVVATYLTDDNYKAEVYKFVDSFR